MGKYVNKKEITKTIITFKSKKQAPLIMIIKLYYKTLQDKKNNNEYFGKVLFCIGGRK